MISSKQKKSTSRIQMRYLGSKRTMMPFLEGVLRPLLLQQPQPQQHPGGAVFGDLFAGSGAVACHFAPLAGRVVASDVEGYSCCITRALLQVPFTPRLQRLVRALDALPAAAGLVTARYSPHRGCQRMFFTVANAMRIDAVRAAIEVMRASGEASAAEAGFLLASLLVSCMRVANTSGHLRTYLKAFLASALQPFKLTPVHQRPRAEFPPSARRSAVLQTTALEAARRHAYDVAYLDPPYTRSHYGAYYGILNYVLAYDATAEVYGTGGAVRGYYKGPYGIRATAAAAFEELFGAIRARHVLVSYNSDGIVPKETMLRLLAAGGGRVVLHTAPNRRYVPGAQVTQKHVTEWLFHVDRAAASGPVGKTPKPARGWVVHGIASCPYTREARALLRAKGIAYTWHAHKNSSDPALRKVKDATGHPTVPIVLRDGRLLGGYRELAAALG